MKFTTHFALARARIRVDCAGRAVALLTLCFSGCSILPKPTEDPTRYYLLAAASHAEDTQVAPKGTLRVGIRAVDLPIYLRNTRTLVIRSGANEVRYEDYARWAEPLDLAVQRAVRDRLQLDERVAGAEVPPFSTESHRDFDVTIQLLQCEGTIDPQGRKMAQFAANYEISDQRDRGRAIIRRAFSAPAGEWDGKDFSALAARLGEGVTALAADILVNLPK